MRICELKQVDTEKITKIRTIEEIDENGNITYHDEPYTELKPVMKVIYRDMTEEEIASIEELPPLEPTEADKLEAQVMYTAMITDTLLEEV